ncbi:MAG: GNAT family N-acetyltransferase [Candidatus Lokiarchaeota archaeon]|nr:GNAT family N-acetyltransferase [Candidatus Lokiarchaeota archaeon]
MVFQNASLSDIDEICQINHRLLRMNVSDKNRGFLLGERSKSEIMNSLGNYYVIKEENQVLGYLEIDFKIERKNFRTGIWENVQIQDKILEKMRQKKYIYLVQIAVKKQRMGIGRQLIHGILKKFEGFLMISFVVSKPYYNEASCEFFEKLGFIRGGCFSLQSKFGILGYERFCYVK